VQNTLTVDAVIKSKDVLRFTPVGIEVQEVLLRHTSSQQEGDSERKVSFELHAVAIGEPAKALTKAPTDCLIRFQGYLTRRFRTGLTLSLRVTSFELIDPITD
jgi:primosomal replication protein N